MGPSKRSLKIAKTSRKLAVTHPPEIIFQAITGAMTILNKLKELARLREIFTYFDLSPNNSLLARGKNSRPITALNRMKKKSNKSDVIVCCGDISIFEGGLEFNSTEKYINEIRNIVGVI